MHETYMFPTSTPKNDFTPARVLRDCWLPLMISQAEFAEYDDIEDSLLCDMFEQALHYGPHIDEMQAYLSAFVDLFETVGVTVADVAENTFVQQLRLDFITTYAATVDTLDFDSFVAAQKIERITPNMIDRRTYLPKQFTWDVSGQVVAKIKLNIVSDAFKEAMNSQPLQAALALSVSLVLLQYAYLPELLLDDSDRLYAKRATERNLVRGHNAFCEKYGLPTLQYASDAHINSVR